MRRKRKSLGKKIISSFLLLGLVIIAVLLIRQPTSKKNSPTIKVAAASTETTSVGFSKKANKALTKRTELKQLPLILQKDERWHDVHYGSNTETDTFAKNGCAIAVLAMIDSYWTKSDTSIEDILAWSGNEHFVEGQGTSWFIFSEFAEEFGYNLYNPNSIYAAEDAIAAGQPVIVSLQPGTFTTTGHFLILYADTAGELVVYDPNDDETKNHYSMSFSREIFENEALNYWVLSK